VALIHIQFRVNGRDLVETTTSAVPRVGETVVLELVLDGRHTYQVTAVTHWYADSGARRVASVRPAPIIIDLIEIDPEELP
jgi:hypothetical protein